MAYIEDGSVVIHAFHVVTVAYQVTSQVGADEAGGSGDNYVQTLNPLSSITLNRFSTLFL